MARYGKKKIVVHEIGGKTYAFDTMPEFIEWIRVIGYNFGTKSRYYELSRYIDDDEILKFRDVSGRHREFIIGDLADMEYISEERTR